jgi:hypothetical protein
MQPDQITLTIELKLKIIDDIVIEQTILIPNQALHRAKW